MATRIRSTFDSELNAIHMNFTHMGELVRTAIGLSMQALKDQDLVLAANVIADDTTINDLRYNIEEACLTLIATQQPIAGDLRAIIAIMHSAVEMERMGDHAAGIAKTVIKSGDERPLKPGKKLSQMAELSQAMLTDCIEAFITHDAKRASEIAARDTEMDQLYKVLFDRLIKVMGEHPKLIPRATYLMWCGHNLERIADRVTNLAEQIVFMTTGQMKELGS
jgi:phosphate transport system protein